MRNPFGFLARLWALRMGRHRLPIPILPGGATASVEYPKGPWADGEALGRAWRRINARWFAPTWRDAWKIATAERRNNLGASDA
jgi:hypothetical protein